jgi:NADPH:quinone reductase-like Zn-dependent oxidoreductase
MKAVAHQKYGTPEVLALRDVDRPVAGDDQVLVRVEAASLNALDWHFTTGTPYVMRLTGGLRAPKRQTLGVDVAGTVEAVGRNVTTFQPGDEVFGIGSGSCAEYVVASADRIVHKPAEISFEQAAAVPTAAVTALQALRDRGQIAPGQKVLVNGAAGGVGTYAVQIAKALGAEVTAVCSTRNVEQARSLGADRVLDYTQTDFTRDGERYDVVLDVTGTKSWSGYRRVMNPDAKLVLVGAPKTRLLGPLGHIARIKLAAWRGSQKAVFFVANFNTPDLETLRELVESGQIKPVVESRYELGDAAEALRQLGEGHARGKIVISV